MTRDVRSSHRLWRTGVRAPRVLVAGLAAATALTAVPGPTAPADAAHLASTVSTSERTLETNAPGPLVATDALGRELADYTDAPRPRPDRTVGLFYVLWHGSNDMREYKNIYDNNATLAEDPLAWQNPGSGAFPPPGHFAYWGEPLYGYHRSDDAWVIRRDLQMFADAQVDYLVLDASNWEIYKPQAIVLMRTIVELQAQGVRAPQVVFMTHTDSTSAMDEIYRTFYADDAPHRYPSTWFHWDGKPLILGADPSSTVQQFFTFRYAQWPNEEQREQGWDWISFDRPQRGNYDADGTLEQMAVSPAQNSGSSSVFSYTAWYGLDEVPSRSRSFHDGAEDESPGAQNQGYNFQEQWDHAIEQDPETILILEWNEWIAGNWANAPDDPLMFYDVVNTRWSRDLAPMVGGYQDNYYLQMVDNIRRYKGVSPPATPSDETTIDLHGSFRQWADVAPEYTDYRGDTEPRHHPGVGNETYVNQTGRNDIVSSKVARDDQFVYFYARTAQDLTPISETNWMTLYLGTDADGTNGWHGYDHRVRFRADDPTSARLERAGADGETWQVVADDVAFRTAGDELMVAIARDDIGLGADPLRLEFSWWDNQQDDTIMDAYVSGDAAPDGRFNYLYDAGEHPAAEPAPEPPDVAAPPEQRPGQYRIENDDRATDYEAFVTPEAATWVEVDDPDSSGGSHSYLYNPGGGADRFFRTFVRAGFDGNSVRWVAPTGPDGTEAEVFIDGLSQGVVNLYRSQPARQQSVFEARGLPEGRHEIMVVFEPQSGTYYHDYFEYGVGPAGLGGGIDPADPAATAFATASSFDPAEWFATNAGQVNDGNPATYWRGTRESGDDVTLSFGRTVPFDRVRIVPRTTDTTVTSFELQVHDHRGWSVVHRGGELTAASTIELGATRGDRIRLVVDETSGGPPEIAELSVGSRHVPTPERSATSWEFTSGVDGWSADGPLNGPVWSEEGAIGGDVSGAAASLLSPDGLDVAARDYPSVLVKLRNGTEARQARLRYVATSESGETVTESRPFRIEPDSSYVDYVVDLTDAPGWSGTIEQLGLEVSADSGRIDVQYVRMAPDHAVVASHFTTDRHGWTGQSADPRWSEDGSISLAVNGTDDVLTSPANLQADITNADTVTLRLRNASSATRGTVRFATEASPEFAPERSVSFDLIAHDEDVRTYQVDMSNAPGWEGLLHQLQVEFSGAAPGEQVVLDAVRVEPFVLNELNTKRSWTFDTGTESWGNAGAIEGFGWRDGGVGGTIAGPDPQFYSQPTLWLDLTELSTITVRMAIETEAEYGTVYFTTEASPNFSEANSVRIPLDPDATGYVDYVLDMTGVDGWRGVLRQLRVDPAEGAAGGTFHVDSIEIG